MGTQYAEEEEGSVLIVLIKWCLRIFPGVQEALGEGLQRLREQTKSSGSLAPRSGFRGCFFSAFTGEQSGGAFHVSLLFP